MDIANIRTSLGRDMAGAINFYERRPGIHQLIVPIFHEDGDMIDIYVQDSPKGEGFVRICDFGMALMRLSYTFELSTPTREAILNGILVNNSVSEDDGNLYLDAPATMLYQSVLQFSGCVQKVCNMHYWNRETVRSAFYDDLGKFVSIEMKRFSPIRNHVPLDGDDTLSVDWLLEHGSRNLYLFGVRGNDKAKDVTISLLEFQKAGLPFFSVIVHENSEDLGKRPMRYLMKNADKQYPRLDDFTEKGIADIERWAA